MARRFNDENFRVALVKESVPLMILALADYITEYFEENKDRKQLVKELFNTLYVICTGNNNCKGQIFKGDGLRHLTSLIDRENNACFFFLNRICDSDDNIAIFLGRGFFSEIIRVYKKFQQEILEDYKFAANDLKNLNGKLDQPINKNIDVDDWVLYIILNKLFSKLMDKKFINETAKLQSSLEIQEALFPSLGSILLPTMMSTLSHN
jgi:hemerythrin-like domain-containing protein